MGRTPRQPQTTKFDPFFPALAFSTADVVIVGARLGKLVELLNEHDLGSVSVVDARYAATLGKQPWVASIVIARLDKSSGVAG
jgi:hypothetical protein